VDEADAGVVGDRPPLTPRQREVLQLIAEGNGTRLIAEKLAVSVKTIETHRAQIMERLGIHDVAGLTRYALRIGMIGPD
jgi:DNA-binding NarL/FixJ family response regulator